MQQSIMDDDNQLLRINEKKLLMTNKNIKKLCVVCILMDF